MAGMIRMRTFVSAVGVATSAGFAAGAMVMLALDVRDVLRHRPTRFGPLAASGAFRDLDAPRALRDLEHGWN